MNAISLLIWSLYTEHVEYMDVFFLLHIEFSAVNRINSIIYLHNLRATDAFTLDEE